MDGMESDQRQHSAHRRQSAPTRHGHLRGVHRHSVFQGHQRRCGPLVAHEPLRTRTDPTRKAARSARGDAAPSARAVSRTLADKAYHSVLEIAPEDARVAKYAQEIAWSRVALMPTFSLFTRFCLATVTCGTSLPPLSSTRRECSDPPIRQRANGRLLQRNGGETTRICPPTCGLSIRRFTRRSTLPRGQRSCRVWQHAWYLDARGNGTVGSAWIDTT